MTTYLTTNTLGAHGNNGYMTAKEHTPWSRNGYKKPFATERAKLILFGSITPQEHIPQLNSSNTSWHYKFTAHLAVSKSLQIAWWPHKRPLTQNNPWNGDFKGCFSQSFLFYVFNFWSHNPSSTPGFGGVLVEMGYCAKHGVPTLMYRLHSNAIRSLGNSGDKSSLNQETPILSKIVVLKFTPTPRFTE